MYVGLDAEGLVVANEGGDGRGVDHDFIDGNAARLINAREQQLGNDCLQNGGELDADGFLLVNGEGVDQTVNGLGRAGGVEGAKDQVARFGGGDSRFHGFQVAQFADEHDIRVLAQGAAEGLGKTGNVNVDFPLSDERLFVSVIVFNGVFDGDDMGVVALFVDDVDHRGQRGGFA